MGKTCCITGHRKLPQEKLAKIKIHLRQTILSAIEEGYDHFISGFAQGVDLLFAELVLEAKSCSPILLQAAIPYRNRLKTGDAAFQKIFLQCDAYAIISDTYHPNCFMTRNRWMVDHSDMVIAVYDGRIHGGTVGTMEYAKSVGKKLFEIHI